MSGTGNPPQDPTLRPNDLRWATWFTQHRRAMTAVAASILRPLGRADMAEDAVMQAILTLMAHPPPSITNPEALLVAAAKRKAIDITRSHDLSKRVRRELHDGDLQAADMERDVVNQIYQERAIRQALAAIASLPSLQRRIVTATVIEGLTTRQVAAELGISPARVSQLRRTLLNVLRVSVGEEHAARWPSDQ